jgi:pimeloyl-ACP methyl ester carboxylesterase
MSSELVGTTVSYTVAPGMKIVGSSWGDPGGPPVLLLHGGGQTRNAWDFTAAGLARAGFHAVAADLRGHGESSWAADGDYTDNAIVQDVAALVRTFDAPVNLVGASLGGIVSLIAISEVPGLAVSSLTLVDIAHRTNREAAQQIRDFMLGSPEGFASIDEAADAVARYLPHRKRPSNNSGLLKNLRQRGDGRYYWHWDPVFMQDPEKRAESGQREQRLTDAARSLSIPTLLVRGGMSSIMSEEGVREFLDLVPHAEFVSIDRAAHMVAGDQADVFADVVIEFLRRIMLEREAQPAPTRREL